jgi:hypothetical protein
MKFHVLKPDQKTKIEVEHYAAHKIGAFIVHPEFHGLDVGGGQIPIWGKRWTVSIQNGNGLGCGAYKTRAKARATAKALQPLVQNEHGTSLAEVFGSAANVAFDVARPNMG